MESRSEAEKGSLEGGKRGMGHWELGSSACYQVMQGLRCLKSAQGLSAIQFKIHSHTLIYGTAQNIEQLEIFIL